MKRGTASSTEPPRMKEQVRVGMGRVTSQDDVRPVYVIAAMTAQYTAQSSLSADDSGAPVRS